MPKSYITRDKKGDVVELWTVRPDYNPVLGGFFPQGGLALSFCWKDWKRLTHPKLHIKKGELKELDGMFTVTKPRGGK